MRTCSHASPCTRNVQIKGNKHEKPKAKQKKKQNKRQKKQGKGKDSTVKEETVSSSSSSSSSDTGAAAEDDDSAYNRLSKAQRLKKMKQMKKINIVDIRTANRQRAVTYKDILQADLIITTTVRTRWCC